MSIPFKKFGYKLNPITQEIETPQVFLVNKRLEKLGELYPVEGLHVTINEVNQPNEASFTYYKETNGIYSPLFDELVDLSVIQIGTEFFEISVSKSETNTIVKKVSAKSLGFAELSQVLATLEVNTDDDMARSDYDVKFPTVFYREEKITDSEDERKKKRDSSLLNRILSYAPHYSVGYVDPTLKNVQRTFSWDNTDIVSILNDVSEEIGCVFDLQVTVDENGETQRIVNAYDVQYCETCWDALNTYEKETVNTHTFRNIVNGVCQNCGSSEHIVEIGEDSGIFISTENLSDEITMTGNRDNIKNCFKIVGGDDVITATVQGLNLSASNKVMMFSDDQKKLMSEELVHKIEEYNKEYDGMRSTYEKLLETQYNIYDMILYLKSGKMPLMEKTITSIPDAIIETLEQIKLVYQNHFYVRKKEEFGYASVNYSIKNLFTAFMPKGFSFTIDTDELIQTEFYGWTGKIMVYQTGNRDDFYTIDVKRTGSTVTHGKSEKEVTFPNIQDRNIVSQFRVQISFASGNEEKYLTYLQQHTACLLKTLDLSYENQQRKEWNEFCYERLKSFYDGYSTCIESLDEMLIEADFESKKIIQDIQKSYETIRQDIHAQMKVLMDQIFALSFYAGEFSNDFLDKDGTVSYRMQSLSGVLDAFHGMVSTDNKGGYLNGIYFVNEFIGTKPCKCMDCLSINVSPLTDNANVCNNCGGNHVYSYADMMKEIAARFESDWNEEPRMDYVQFVNLMDQRKAIQQKFDIRSYFGDTLYKELLSFIREDVYQNDNYTSDGLTNAQIISQSKELMAKASQELSKACMNQYTITASVSSIVSQTAFEYQGVSVGDIYSGFTINNRVHVKIDDDVYTLRIASINMSFPVTDKTEVTFTNVTNYYKGAVSDVASILQEASNMASTYSYVATQAEKGEAANTQFDTMKNEGLDACLMAVKGGQDQDVIIDNHGILLRKKVPEIDDYSPYQMKVINRNIVLTKDRWKTASLAIGLGQYNGELVYGVWTDLLVGDLIITKKLHVANDNGTVVIDENGITLNGGAIRWTKKLPQSAVENLESTLEDFISKTVYNEKMTDLQNQIDGNIMTWFYEYVPTDTNKPALDWKTDKEKIAHEGDLFYCTDSNNAHAWRYVYNDTKKQHEWLLIEDTDVTKALADAAKAQDTADNKRRVFVSTPTPPYDEGDLWVQGDEGDIMRCQTGRQSGSYVSSDWVKASKYTDDTKAEEVENNFTNYKSEIEEFRGKIDSSLSLAQMGDDYIISPKIGGGYLCIANNEYSVEIDPKNEGKTNTKDDYLFCIRNKNETKEDNDVIMGVNANGDGYFNGEVMATSGRIGAYNIDPFSLSCSNEHGYIALQNVMTITGAPSLFSYGERDDNGCRNYVNVSCGKINFGQIKNSVYMTHMEISENNDYPGVLFYSSSDSSGTLKEVGAIRRQGNHIGIKTFNGNRTTIDGKTLNNMVISSKVELKSMTLEGNYDGYNTGNEIPSVNGYTPISVSPHSSNAPDVCWMCCYIDSSNKIYAGLKNTTSSAKTFTPSVQILYVKDF